MYSTHISVKMNSVILFIYENMINYYTSYWNDANWINNSTAITTTTMTDKNNKIDFFFALPLVVIKELWGEA